MNQKDEISVDEMMLSPRITRCLKRAKFYTIQDLLMKSDDENFLVRIIGIGKDSAREIIDSIHKMGYKFNYELKQEEKNKKHSIEMVHTQEDKMDVDTQLLTAIAELRASYEELRVENNRLQVVRAEVLAKLQNVGEEILESKGKIERIEKFIQENADLLRELGEFKVIQQKLRQARRRLGKQEEKKEKLEDQNRELSEQEQEIVKRKKQIQKDLEQMLQEL